jgi:hypothetical protein
MKKNLIEEIEKFNMMVNYDPSKVLSEQDTKTLNLGFNYNKNDKPRAWGKHGGGAMGGISAKLYTETNLELETSDQLLIKMNKELSSNEEYSKIPQEIKELLSKGFFEAILNASNSKHIKDLTAKYKKNIKKFFRKSQRWEFVIADLPTQSEEEFPNKLNISVPTTESFTKDKLAQQTLDMITQVNTRNSSLDGILAKQCNALKEENVEKIKSVKTFAFNKQPLSTVFVYEIKPPKEYIQSEGGFTYSENKVSVDIPNKETNFAAGKIKDENFAREIVDEIYNQLMSKVFETTLIGKKVQKTGKQIIDDFISTGTGGIYINLIHTISSASNTWNTKDVLDFTHENDGTKVKEFSALETKGNNGKNVKLSKDRNDYLTTAVIAALIRKPGIINIEDVQYSQDVRVTNTGGMLDKDAKVKGLKPGQYAGFKLEFDAMISLKEEKERKKLTQATLGQKLIELKWKGKFEGGFEIDFGIMFSGGEKNIILYRPLIDLKWIMATIRGDSLKSEYGSLRRMPDWLSKRRGYK